MSLTGVVASIETIEPRVSIVKVQITTSKVIQFFFLVVIKPSFIPCL